MMRHATDPMVFVRSMATRGHLGGLTLGVSAVIRVMALIGCDVVMIETAGVGQSEVEVAGVADLVLVVLAPGQGDSVQLLKAGLMEIGDLLRRQQGRQAGRGAVARRGPGDAQARRGLMRRRRSRIWRCGAGRRTDDRIEPCARLVSAATGDGVPALLDDLELLSAKHVRSVERATRARGGARGAGSRARGGAAPPRSGAGLRPVVRRPRG